VLFHRLQWESSVRVLDLVTGKVEVTHDIQSLENEFLTLEQFVFMNDAEARETEFKIENLYFEDDSDYESDDSDDVPAPLPATLPATLPERPPYFPAEREIQTPPPVVLQKYPIPAVPIPQRTELSQPATDEELPPPVASPPPEPSPPAEVIPTGHAQREKIPSWKIKEQQQGLASARIAVIGEEDSIRKIGEGTGAGKVLPPSNLQALESEMWYKGIPTFQISLMNMTSSLRLLKTLKVVQMQTFGIWRLLKNCKDSNVMGHGH
jgi:hypothetical protein